VLVADDRVTTVTVTVLPSSAGRFRERLGRIVVLHWVRFALATAVALAAAGVIIAAAQQSTRKSRPTAARRVVAADAERTAIAAAYGYPYPARCLTIAIFPANPDYARADIDRTEGCGRYHGYLNASFHRVDGTWRLELDEGQLFVPNSLLTACAVVGAGCARAGTPACFRRAVALHDPVARAAFDRPMCARARAG
jgi:hypothetical protein